MENKRKRHFLASNRIILNTGAGSNPMIMSNRNGRSNSSVARSRHRIETANKRDAELIAAEIAMYEAAFRVSQRRLQGKLAVNDLSGTFSAPAEAVDDYAPIDRNDPTTWRRPNLDKLKASILADWKGDLASV